MRYLISNFNRRSSYRTTAADPLTCAYLLNYIVFSQTDDAIKKVVIEQGCETAQRNDKGDLRIEAAGYSRCRKSGLDRHSTSDSKCWLHDTRTVQRMKCGVSTTTTRRRGLSVLGGGIWYSNLTHDAGAMVYFRIYNPTYKAVGAVQCDRNVDKTKQKYTTNILINKLGLYFYLFSRFYGLTVVKLSFKLMKNFLT